jgi:ADP-heptose:LPS heptosyltransferase
MALHPQKILIIRLSSIGDIVLTSPIIRSLHTCFPQASIQFLTKKAYQSLLEQNPHINKLHLFDGDLNATVRELKAEGFDLVVDLHRNIRSRMIKVRLGVRASTYSKDRWPVWRHIRLGIGELPEVHTVERYARAITPLGCELDEGGLEFFIPDAARAKAKEAIDGQKFPSQPIVVVLGGKYFTKRWPREYFVELLNGLGLPVVLLGDKAEVEDAAWIKERLQIPVFNAVAQMDLLTGAAVMERCRFVITHDTGLMHIAVALDLKIFSIWGNTVPELGFAPYRAKESVIIGNEGLYCRPCTKLGYEKCPKGHFRCMMELTPAVVKAEIQSRL